LFLKLSNMSLGQEVLVLAVDLEEDVGKVSQELDGMADDVDELLARLDSLLASKDGLLWVSLATNLVLRLAIFVVFIFLFCWRRKGLEAKVKPENKVEVQGRPADHRKLSCRSGSLWDALKITVQMTEMEVENDLKMMMALEEWGCKEEDQMQETMAFSDHQVCHGVIYTREG